jgi:hypothetical protein
MSQAVRRLEAFFFSPLPRWPMAICRAVFGLSIFFHYINLGRDFRWVFGPEGMTGAGFHQSVPGAIALGRTTSSAVDWLSYVTDERIFYVLFGILLIASLSFAAGFATRTSGVVTLLIHTLFHAHNEWAFWGWGDVIKPFLLYVIASDAGRFCSVDAALRGRIWPETWNSWKGPAWPVRLLQIHLCACYMTIAWTRIGDPDWLNGTEVYGILTDSLFARFDADFFAQRHVFAALTYFFWCVELSAPVLLWLPRLGKTVVAVLLFMHAGLDVLTLVGYWNFMMIAALTVFLIPQQKLEEQTVHDQTRRRGQRRFGIEQQHEAGAHGEVAGGHA